MRVVKSIATCPPQHWASPPPSPLLGLAHGTLLLSHGSGDGWGGRDEGCRKGWCKDDAPNTQVMLNGTYQYTSSAQRYVSSSQSPLVLDNIGPPLPPGSGEGGGAGRDEGCRGGWCKDDAPNAQVMLNGGYRQINRHLSSTTFVPPLTPPPPGLTHGTKPKCPMGQPRGGEERDEGCRRGGA